MNQSTKTTLRLLFDLSLLAGSAGVVSRSGIVRFAEEFAIELCRCPELEVSFSGFRDWNAMLAIDDYVQDHPRLTGNVIRGPRQPLKAWMLQNIGRALWRVPFAKPACFCIEQRRQASLRPLTLPIDLTRFDIVHSPFYPIPADVKQRCLASRIPVFTTVHDIIPLRLKPYGDPQNPHFQMVRSMVHAFDRDDWIFCDSNFTRDDLLSETSNLDPSRVFVVPLAASDKFRPTAYQRTELLAQLFGPDVSDETVFFVSLSSLEPRKNLETVVRAFERLTHLTDADARLALIGVRTHLGSTVLDDIQKLACADRIRYLGPLRDDLLPQVYSAAHGFIYLSIYEGFGLPPLEAMQCGTPTIVSNATSLPEVVGNAGVIVEPKDEDAVANTMLQLIEDSSFLESLRTAGLKRARTFSWAESVKKATAIYQVASEAAQ